MYREKAHINTGKCYSEWLITDFTLKSLLTETINLENGFNL